MPAREGFDWRHDLADNLEAFPETGPKWPPANPVERRRDVEARLADLEARMAAMEGASPVCRDVRTNAQREADTAPARESECLGVKWAKWQTYARDICAHRARAQAAVEAPEPAEGPRLDRRGPQCPTSPVGGPGDWLEDRWCRRMIAVLGLTGAAQAVADGATLVTPEIWAAYWRRVNPAIAKQTAEIATEVARREDDAEAMREFRRAFPVFPVPVAFRVDRDAGCPGCGEPIVPAVGACNDCAREWVAGMGRAVARVT